MPMIIEHIDAIARKKKRDVLLLEFTKAQHKTRTEVSTHYEDIESRKMIIEWFDANAVPWTMCGEIARENGWTSYEGQIYIDVPYDLINPTYQDVQEFLEWPDGTCRFDDVKFWILSLEMAMENAHHDEPGFWERHAEGF